MRADPRPIEEALALHRAGELAEAETAYRAILSAEPGHPAAMHFLGYLAYQCGRLQDAVGLMNAALAREPGNAIFHNNLGEAYRAAGRWDEAIRCYRRAMFLTPGYSDPCANVVLALRAAGRNDEALAEGREAVQRHPSCARAFDALGQVLQDRARWPEAAASHRRALDLEPNFAEAHTNLGFALVQLREPEAAGEHHRGALSLNPSLAAAQVNLGSALEILGRWDEARTAYEQAIALAPKLPQAHAFLSTLLLLHEDYERGWTEFEWRLKCGPPNPAPELHGPIWEGQPLAGRTILIYNNEGGFGDSLHFIRYATLLTKRGATVAVACEPELCRLFQSIPGVRIFAREGSLPRYDFHSPLQSLPRYFRTNTETIPADVPYLGPTPEAVEHWRECVAALPGLRVGIAWAGSGTDLRSDSLETFAACAEVRGVSFVSLQKGRHSAHALQPPAGMRIVDWTGEIADFADAAGLVSLLDLVITVDTSTAHLAGALARPTWVLIPSSPDFRWLLGRNDSPWYPTMRLYRQSKLYEWEEPVRAMADDLAKWSRNAR